MAAGDAPGGGAGSRPSRHKARRLALQAVYQWLIAASDVDDLINQFARSPETRGADWRYTQHLIRGVTRYYQALEGRLAPHLDRPLEQLDPVEHTVLLLGAFELIHCPDVPFRVSINESINLAKVFGATDSYKYINGILDRLAAQLRGAQSGAS